MQITANRLKDILTTLKLIVPKRPVLPVLKYALLQDGKAVATNLECMAVINLPEAKEPMLLPVKEVLDWVKFIDKTTVLEVIQKDKTIAITEVQKQGSLTGDCGIASSSFESAMPEDFPPVVSMPEDMITQQIDGDWLVESIGEAVVYSEKDGRRPVLNAVCITLEPDKIKIAGADGFRLYAQEDVLETKIKASLLIPREVVPILKFLWGKAVISEGQPDIILMAFDKEHEGNGYHHRIAFQFGNMQFYSQLIKGTYPNYPQLIPENQPVAIKFFALDMMQAVNRVAALAKQDRNIVRLEWSADNQMIVSSKYGDQKSSSAIKIQGATEPGRIAMNCQYLSEYFKGKSKFIEMGFSNYSSPVKFQDGESIVVIMPKFVQWDDTQGEESPEAANSY